MSDSERESPRALEKSRPDPSEVLSTEDEPTQTDARDKKIKKVDKNRVELLDNCYMHLKQLRSAKTAKPWWRCFVVKKVDDRIVYLLDDKASVRNEMHQPSV